MTLLTIGLISSITIILAVDDGNGEWNFRKKNTLARVDFHSVSGCLRSDREYAWVQSMFVFVKSRMHTQVGDRSKMLSLQ